MGEGEKSPETIEREINDETDTETENNENNDETDTETENDEQEERDENEEETENKDESRNDLQNDVIGAKYLQVEKSVYFMDYEIFSLEVPVKEHRKPEIIEAKNTEIENLRTYETFEDH